MVSNHGGNAAPGERIVILTKGFWETVLERDAGHAQPVSR